MSERRVLAKRKTARGHAPLESLGLLLAQLDQTSHGRHVEGGLRDQRLVQLLLGTVGANLEQVVSENFLGLGEHVLHLGKLSIQALGHADLLGTLTRKAEHGAFGVCDSRHNRNGNGLGGLNGSSSSGSSGLSGLCSGVSGFLTNGDRLRMGNAVNNLFGLLLILGIHLGSLSDDSRTSG